jgi:CRP-like cAMP-binding protein
MTDTRQKLVDTPLGEQLGEAHATQLAELMTPVTVDAGELLFDKGSDGDALFIVVTGAFDVLLDEDLKVAALEPGSIVGELEVLANGKRAASVKATEPSTCLRLPAEALQDKPEGRSDVIDRLLGIVARALAVRLAAINDKVVAAWRLTSKVSKESQDEVIEVVHEVLDDVWQ